MSELAPPVQERDVVRWGLGLLLLSAVVVIIAGSVVWARGLVRAASPTGIGTGARERAVSGPAAIAGVHVDPIAAEPGLTLRRGQSRSLSTYGWVDRSQGVVRIPIERAMELVAEGHAPPLGPAPEEGR